MKSISKSMSWGYLAKAGAPLFGAALGLTLLMCSSESEAPAANTVEGARALFVQKVCPSITASCQQCHQKAQRGAPVFLGANCDASYAAIEGFPGLLAAPNQSPIVQKGPHSGPALTPEEEVATTEWLSAEVIARNLEAGDSRPKNLRAALKAFSDCMDYGRWTALKLDTIFAENTDGNQGQCVSCHNTGQGGAWFSADGAVTFNKFRDFPFVQKLVIGLVNEQGAFTGLEYSFRLPSKGNEAQQTLANNHPRYSLSAELMSNLQTYVNETLSNMNAGRCDNVTLPPPDAGMAPAH